MLPVDLGELSVYIELCEGRQNRRGQDEEVGSVDGDDVHVELLLNQRGVSRRTFCQTSAAFHGMRAANM